MADYYGDEITVRVRDPLTVSDASAVLDQLSPHFLTVRAERRQASRQVRTLPLPESIAVAALTFTGLAVAKGFLEELGKDTWRALRDGLSRLYQHAQQAVQEPDQVVFAFEVLLDDRTLAFEMRRAAAPQGAEFQEALMAAKDVLAVAEAGNEDLLTASEEDRLVFIWDGAAKKWSAAENLDTSE